LSADKFIITGAGLAGLSAAISCAKHGRVCILVSAQASERAQSVLAEGGINAALNTKGEHDSIYEHYTDTIECGSHLADPNAVEGLVNAAPEIVDMLVRLGVPFNRDGSLPDLRSFGGQKKKRTAFAKSSTGKMLMTALIDEARKYEARGLIERMPHHTFVELFISDGQCGGCFIRDTYTDEVLYLRGMVILASGGLNGMFGEHTTGTVQNTGEVTATVFRQGVTLGNLEFIQYHPTTIPVTGKRCLLSEAARGEGGRLFVKRDGVPWYFMEEKYPELGNLTRRDIVTREMTFIRGRKDCGSQIYLDMTHIRHSVWADKLTEIREECIHYLSLDPEKEPVPVEPGIHYFMGGILVDAKHRTNIKYLFAAGECSCQYHGANRMGGNSMLGAIYGGRTAVNSAIEDAETYKPDFQNQSACDYPAEKPAAGILEKLASILLKGLWIVRSEQQLLESIKELDALREQDGIPVNMQDRILLGLAMLESALSRKESRGSHYREDYPAEDEIYRKTTTASFDGTHINIEFQDIPNIREQQN